MSISAQFYLITGPLFGPLFPNDWGSTGLSAIVIIQATPVA